MEAVAEHHQELAPVSAKERKMTLTHQEPSSTSHATPEFTLIELLTINNLLRHSLCQQCGKVGLSVAQSTKHGLAVKSVLSGPVCRDVVSTWSSPCHERS